ncbi:MAG: UDP-N-acetylglucosamine 1-carboxyvinyltransferase [Calditrichaeota bacterium]|nr:UDP-N-acetylglucosamine 1-carboxyvinyltransferase [Calditrichota bacterium]
MSELHIQTSRGLSGRITPQGNKNEALPIVAACLLNPGVTRLDNLPEILDVRAMLQIVQGLGARVERSADGHSAVIQADTLDGSQPDPVLCAQIRASLLLAAPLLARRSQAGRGSVILPRPGGDRIGRRRIDTHLAVFETLGATVDTSPRDVRLSLDGPFRGAHLFLDEASVMATENAVMAAAMAEGDSVIENAACEPHVQQLCRLLVQMGSNIQGIGTNRLCITGTGGVPTPRELSHRVLEDLIEVGSFIALAAATGSELSIPGVTPANYWMVAKAFERLGVRFTLEGNTLHVPANQELEVQSDRFGEVPRIHDAPWPGFPADLSSIAVVLACCANGSVLIHEWMFESRLYWVDSLIGMGARITQCDPHRVLVNGGAPLFGTRLSSPDIRAGMALLIAALRAEGTTVIQNIRQIDRGYERIDERLAALGARIKRVAE